MQLENENDDNREQQPLQRPNREVKLTPFWPSNPEAWFSAAEGKFYLRGIDDELAPVSYTHLTLPTIYSV